jgi:CubicO group peptidase (beta-lactamase class C family)
MTIPQPFHDQIQRAFREAIDDGVFPGAVLLVQYGGRRRWQAAWGEADRTTGEAVHRETFFDLASLTKPLCTALAVMHLIQSGRLNLEDRLGDAVPAIADSDKADIRIRQLLSHQSGLPAWRPYHEILREMPAAERRDALVQLLVREDLAYRPGSDSVYSDLDFLALQFVVENVGGLGLDRYAAQNLYRPLGLGDLIFTDPTAPPPARAFAATARCAWRGRILKGHVHDDNAYVLGGVAGHAGLFGTATAVADLLSVLLDAYRGSAAKTMFDTHLVRLFFERQSPYDWALGFDTPAVRHSSSGRHFSRNSVGHLGFTGTSFWMDLSLEIIVVLLTNRVHPSPANERIRVFRPLIHDLVMQALEDA